MTEPTDHTLALLRRMDAKLDRLQVDVTHVRGRLQRVDGRLTGISARLVGIETCNGNVVRNDRVLRKPEQPLAETDHATISAVPTG
jgi:hypothetical protein